MIVRYRLTWLESTPERDQAGEIRSKLTQEILPEPARNDLAGGAGPKPHGELQRPTLVKKTEPSYSEAARQARIVGIVHLSLVVEDDGTPSSVHLIEGLGFGLDEEAAKALKQWRFKPGTGDGKAVRVQVRVDMAFKML